MTPADFHYELPEELIAQHPPPDRGTGRMLVVHRSGGEWEDRKFRDLPGYLSPGDALVLNNSRVLPSRLLGRRRGGKGHTQQPPSGQVEALLLEQVQDEPLRWRALVRPGRKIRVGERLVFPEGLEALVVDSGERGERILELESAADFHAVLERAGHMPLPPYIRREDTASDRERYQTVYARRPGSAAAPTAGLHFTPEALEQVRRAGANLVEVTLHVGLGTFQPLEPGVAVEGRRLHEERVEVTPEAALDLDRADRIVAAGTTSVRTLEHAIRQGGGRFGQGFRGRTDLFIYPGFEFRAVGAMLTNFHLPESSLLMLVCAFAGKDLTLAAYRHAVEEGYRFFSYGDAMLIL